MNDDLARALIVGSLTAGGAVVDAHADHVDALLPPELATTLGLAEEVQIDFTGTAAGAVDGRLGAALVERVAARHLASPPLTALVLQPELPRPLPDHLPVLLNAVRAGVAQRSRETQRYLVATLRLTAHSDEVRSALATLVVRLHDGAHVAALPIERGEAHRLARLTDGERRRTTGALQRWVAVEGPRRLASALDAVQRRARRDLERLADYYASLDEEMRTAEQRARSPDERARRAAKRAALPDDLAARRAQIAERIRARLAATLVAATLVETDAERFDLPVRRRSRDGALRVLGRSADARFEGPACVACGVATLRLYLCDERLHVLCDACGHSGRLDAVRCAGCQPRAAALPPLVVDDPTQALRHRLVAARQP